MKLPDVHGVKKGLDPHVVPAKQKQPIVKAVIEKKPRFGQGRTGIQRKTKLVPIVSCT